nr:nuclear matrix constituent protein 1a-like isoform X2 [Lolium perenne]
MLTPPPLEWNGLSTPAQAPADQQIGGAAYGNGQAVPRRITDLEKELHQYQHNMGLLLIDRQDMAAEYDQLSQVYAQNEEILKREQAAHLNAISEYEKREERIRKALCVEKQNAADLEKALHEMRSEIAEVKFVSQKKISGANSFQTNIDENSLLIKKKLSAANAKLAEANLMMSHADKKMEDIEAHQHRCEKEKLCYETEWKAQKNQLKEKEETQDEWEKRLMESHNRQVSFQRSLSGREEKLNAHDKTLKMKQEELQEAKQTNVALKLHECDINNSLHKLYLYEMDIKSKYKFLEEKEEILDDWEERIDMKEKKLIEDQKACRESKIQDFELVMKRERESLSEEMQKIITNLQWREKDLKLKECDLLKSEQELNWNTEMLDAWKHDLDSRSHALKKLEEALKIDEQNMLAKKHCLEYERKAIDMYKLDLEKTMSSTEAEKQSSCLKNQEILKHTKEERDAHSMMLVQLNKVTEGYRVGSNSQFKEADDLRQQKLKLERSWEDLDMEKAHTEEAAKKLSYERTRMESFHDSEKRRLKDVELEVRAKYKKWMEDIRLNEKAFMCDIEQQKLQNDELLEGGRANNKCSFDLHCQNMEMEMDQKQVSKEQELEFKQSELNKKLELVENKIRSMVELNESKIQQIIFERNQIENEKNALVKDQEKLEIDKADIKDDINSLNILSKRLKERREVYKKEKNHLIGLIDKHKVCKTCRVPVFDELDVPGIKDSTGSQYPNLGIEDDDRPLNTERSPHGSGGLIDSTGHFTLLQNCLGHFRSSSSEKAEQSLEHKVSFRARLDNEALKHEEDYEPSRIYEGVNDSFAFSQDTRSYSRDVEKRELESASFGKAGSSSFAVAENILKTQSGDTNSSMEIDANIVSNDASENGSEGGLHSETLNQGERLQNREGRLRSVRRTRTMQAVIDEAKALIGPISEEKHIDQKDFVAASAGSIEQRVENTEVVYSDGDASGAPLRKRQQLGGTATQVPGEKHYNLRHNRVVSAATSSKTRSGEARAPKVGSKRKTEESSSDDAKGASTCGVPSALLSTELGEAAKAHESSHMNLPAEAQEVCTEESDGDGCTEESDGDDEEPPTGNDSFRRWLWIFLTT